MGVVTAFRYYVSSASPGRVYHIHAFSAILPGPINEYFPERIIALRGYPVCIAIVAIAGFDLQVSGN